MICAWRSVGEANKPATPTLNMSKPRHAGSNCQAWYLVWKSLGLVMDGQTSRLALTRETLAIMDHKKHVRKNGLNCNGG